jgi:hypothetical protein
MWRTHGDSPVNQYRSTACIGNLLHQSRSSDTIYYTWQFFFFLRIKPKTPVDKLVSEEEEQNQKLKKAKPQRLEMANHELKTAKKKPVRSAGQHRGREINLQRD